MENIYTVSKPFLAFSRILGLLPMSFQNKPRNGLLKFKLHGVILTCLCASILTYLTSVNLSNNMLEVNTSKVIFIAFNILKNSELVSYLFLFGYQILKLKDCVRFLKLVNKVDDDVSVTYILY